MNIEEFKKIIEKENEIAVAATRNDDVYVIDQNEKKVLAWISGKESNHFTIFSGLSDRKSWNAVNDFAETLPNERGLLKQAN